MSVFLVKSHPYPPSLDTRVLEIEAEKFFYSPESGCFEFLTGPTLVAAVPSSGVFAVVEEDAEFDDYVASSEPDDEGSLEEFLNSLVCPECGEIHEDEDDPTPQEPAVLEAIAPSPEKAVVEFRRYHGEPTWGVSYKGVFAPYFVDSQSIPEYVRDAAELLQSGIIPVENLLTAPLSECPLAEPPNE